MAEQKSGTNVRCKGCASRFFVEAGQEEAPCPSCGQGWRIRWFEAGTAMIVAPLSWREYQIRARKTSDE